MFASLKNKIREETGNDIAKLTNKITSSTVQRFDLLKGRSQHGSSSSINSIVSSDGVESEEIRRRLGKIEADYAKKMDQKELEFREALAERDKQLERLETENNGLLKQVGQLKDALSNMEEFNQKLKEHQEDKDQMENFQNQELSKVKYLVHLRDQELTEKTASLRETTIQFDKLKSEVNRLRRQEEQLNDLQDDLESLRHSSSRDLAALATELAKSEAERRHLSDLVIVLRQRVSNETSDEQHLSSERKLLEQRLEEAHLQLANIKTSWSDKIASLETQVGRLSRQAAEEGAERRRAVEEKDILSERLRQTEAEMECNRLEMSHKETEISRLGLDVDELSKELKQLKSAKEEEILFLRTQLQDATTETQSLQKNLENAENELNKAGDQYSHLQLSINSEHEANESLKQIIVKLEKELGEEKANSLNVQKTLSRVTSEKNTALLRNAEISQQMEFIRQEKKRQENEMGELRNKLSSLEEENRKYIESKSTEEHLKSSINELENQISEKNKSIKTLQLRLADLKKILQQELKTPGSPNFSIDLLDNSAAILLPSQVSTLHFQNSVRRDEEEVNFKYLKHVIIKFLTSREYEAQHLTKAISTLLKFTADEEKLVNDTLEWKRSWFGSRPKLGSNPRSKS